MNLPGLQDWLFAILVGLLIVVFGILYWNKKRREREADEAYEQYFKRLDDADGSKK
jgi:cbb3-type cytochrome oxidase subunit 3